MKTLQRLALVLLFPALVEDMAVAKPASMTRQIVEEECLLQLEQRFENPTTGMANLELSGKIKDIDDAVREKLLKGELCHLERHYLEGYLSWRNGDLIGARNAWYRFLASESGLDNEVEAKRRVEVREFFDWISELLLPQEFASPSLLPAQSPKNKEASEPAAVLKSPPAPAENNAQPLIPLDEVLRRAAQAKHNGHLEKAWRLYHLASQLDPNSAVIKSELAQLENEMK